MSADLLVAGQRLAWSTFSDPEREALLKDWIAASPRPDVVCACRAESGLDLRLQVVQRGRAFLRRHRQTQGTDHDPSCEFFAPAVSVAEAAAQLTNWDFRFLAAWVQGVDIVNAWDRYMGHRGSADLRHIRVTVRALLDVLAGAARRHGDPHTAALFRRDPQAIKALVRHASQQRAHEAGLRERPPAPPTPSRPAAPTLEEFADTLESPDFYSESELQALWIERFGRVESVPNGSASLASAKVPSTGEGASARRRPRETPEVQATRRRARLVTRQLEVLKRLEALLATTPQPEDAVDAWHDAALSLRLGAVHVHTLAQLTAFIERHGHRWYRQVPRVGEQGAQRLVAWLRHHEPTLGPLSAYALTPLQALDLQALAPARQAALVPIERLAVPRELSGLEGTNRQALLRSKIAAVTDYAAVLAWLELYRPRELQGQTVGNFHTYTAYRKEAERFLLWAVFQRGKPLSSLDAIDCAEYGRFLEAPHPKERWIAARKVPRWSPDWRPFDGPLSPASRKYAETVCKHLCRWLVGQRYLDTDPWAGMPRVSRPTPVKRLRALTDRQLQHVQGWLNQLEPTPANDRMRMLFLLGLTSGLRKSELADARVGRLAEEEGGWTLAVWGKGSKERIVPLLDLVVRQIGAHLARRGLAVPLVEGEPDFSLLPPETPLLAQLNDPMAPLTPARIYEIAKDGLTRCAASLGELDRKDAATLRAASTHWLRHSFGRVWADRGGDIRSLSQVMGHASQVTTAIYTRADEKRRRAELTKVFG